MSILHKDFEVKNKKVPFKKGLFINDDGGDDGVNVRDGGDGGDVRSRRNVQRDNALHRNPHPLPQAQV